MLGHQKEHSLQAHYYFHSYYWFILRWLVLAYYYCNSQVAAFTLAMSTTTTTLAYATADSAATVLGGAVLVIGSANQDLTSYTATIPVLGETVLGSKFETSSGGKGANQAIAAAGILASSSSSAEHADVTMICRVGNDVFGHDLLANFQRRGVHCDPESTMLRLLRTEGEPCSSSSSSRSTGVATIVVDETSGDNMIIVTPGANHALTPNVVKTCLETYQDNHPSAPPAVVLVQLEIPYETALQALQTAKELFPRVITILNPAPAPTDPSRLDEFYPYVDIVIPNETELRTISCRSGGQEPQGGAGESQADDGDEAAMAQMLLEKGVGLQAVVCTLGARGAMVVTRCNSTTTARESENADDTIATTTTRYEVTYVDAPDDLPARQEPIIDTIGAGDAFCGALSAYLAAGLSLQQGAGMACGFASMSIRRRGASYPTYEELPQSLRLMAREGSRSSCSSSNSKPTISFVTGNPNKVKEVREILSSRGELPFDIVHQKLQDLPELQGEADDIAREKCRMAAEQIKGACFIEDTSLCFTSLNGLPGPYIASFLKKCGHDGLNKMLVGFDDKSAFASTRIAFTAGPGQEVHLFEGQTHGSIVPPRGSLDFGWDAIFEPNEQAQQEAAAAAAAAVTAVETTSSIGNRRMLTYGEMTSAAKNAVSHRGRSLAKFQSFLVEKANEIQQATTRMKS